MPHPPSPFSPNIAWASRPCLPLSPFILHPSSFLLLLLAASPTTHPASTRLSTTRLSGNDNPQRTLTLHAIAMSAGDPAAVMNFYSANTPDEHAVVAAYGHMASSIASLRKSATDKFGPDGFDNIGFAKQFADQIKSLQSVRIVIAGNQALVYINPDNRPDLLLTRINNTWKIAGNSFRNPPHQAARLEAQATAFDELASEIAANKYRLATDARIAGRAKVSSAMKSVEEKFKSTTQPATRPTALVTPNAPDQACLFANSLHPYPGNT